MEPHLLTFEREDGGHAFCLIALLDVEGNLAGPLGYGGDEAVVDESTPLWRLARTGHHWYAQPPEGCGQPVRLWGEPIEVGRTATAGKPGESYALVEMRPF